MYMELDFTNNNIINLIKNYRASIHQYSNINNDTYINRAIDKIYVINLETDRIRRNYIVRLFEKYGINYDLIVVPKLTRDEYETINNKSINIGEAGCYLSHMYCLFDAIQNSFSNIIIFEDDIILHKDFHHWFEYVLTNSTYDILMLGGTDSNFQDLDFALKYNVSKTYIPQPNSTLYGTYAIMYSQKGIISVFNERLKNPTYMDNNLIMFFDLFKESAQICLPHLVLSDLSTTNLNHKFWIDNELLEKYYLRKFFKNNLSFSDYHIIYLKLLDKESIDKDSSFRDNIDKCLSAFFINEPNKIDIIKLRLSYDFFSTEDILFILN